MSETSPSELARIHRTAEDEVETRRELLTNIAILLERSTESRNWQKGSDEWRADHDRKDTESFAQLRMQVANLESKVGGVSSNIGNLESDRTKVVTAWKTLAWCIGAVTSLALAFAWISEKIIN